MGKIHFTKMHGCGNDYIYVNAIRNDIPEPSETAILLSDRHKGIGSDGLVLIGKSPIPEADFTMRIFNADGSEAMMCGNASRCIGKYVYERGLTEKTILRLLTPSGIKVLMLNVENDSDNRKVESITVDMGEPVFEDKELFRPDLSHQPSTPSPCREGIEEAVFVSMGNPHYVVFVDDVEALDVAAEGIRLEHHPQFPQRSNIEFAEVRPEAIRMRVWERGSGITMACGTGACATAVAACLTRRVGRKSKIIMDGGILSIEWCDQDHVAEGRFFQKNHVYMTGPATFVFDGEIG